MFLVQGTVLSVPAAGKHVTPVNIMCAGWETIVDVFVFVQICFLCVDFSNPRRNRDRKKPVGATRQQNGPRGFGCSTQTRPAPEEQSSEHNNSSTRSYSVLTGRAGASGCRCVWADVRGEFRESTARRTARAAWCARVKVTVHERRDAVWGVVARARLGLTPSCWSVNREQDVQLQTAEALAATSACCFSHSSKPSDYILTFVIYAFYKRFTSFTK